MIRLPLSFCPKRRGGWPIWRQTCFRIPSLKNSIGLCSAPILLMANSNRFCRKPKKIRNDDRCWSWDRDTTRGVCDMEAYPGWTFIAWICRVSHRIVERSFSDTNRMCKRRRMLPFQRPRHLFHWISTVLEPKREKYPFWKPLPKRDL